MATFNSTQNGNWNTDATWAEAGHPTANDDITIITHDVTYDVGVSAVTWGNCTINSPGVLIFPIAASSKMLFNATGILTVNNGGELRAGTSGAPIGSAYLCQIHWSQGAAARYVLVLNSGGILNIYGDPGYYGSSIEAVLDSSWDASAGLTLYVKGDYSSKWAAGQHFVIHDYAAYGNYNTDAESFEIDSVGAYDAGNDRTPIVVTAAGDGDTFVADAGLWMLSRNVELLDPGSSWDIYGFGSYTERIRFDNNQSAATDNMMIKDALMRGWESASYFGNNFKAENVVVLNCNYGLYLCPNSEIINGLIVSTYYGLNSCNTLSFSGWCIGNYRGSNGGNYNTFEADFIGNYVGIYSLNQGVVVGNFYSNQTGVNIGLEVTIIGDFKNNHAGIYGIYPLVIYGNIENNVTGISTCQRFRLIGNLKNNSTGMTTCKEESIVQGADISGNTNNFSGLTAGTDKRRIVLERCTVDAVFKELEILANCGSFLCIHNGDGDWQAPGSGSAYILKALTNIHCTGKGSTGLLDLSPLFKTMSFGYTTAGAKTLTFKVYPVGWSSSLTDAELFLEVYYLAGVSGGVLTRAISGSLTMANGAWRDLTVAFTTGQEGIFYYNLTLKHYEAGDYVLIDPEWSIS